MAHAEQAFFVAQCRKHFPSHFSGSRVLEIGSLDINGSVRQFFDASEYIGIDVGAGPGVDVVAGGETFAGETAGFDVVISCEAMEHNPYWRETFINAIRMLKPDGIMIMSCAGYGRRQHGTARFSPADSPNTVALGSQYYRNLGEADFRTLGNFADWFSWHGFFADHVIRDLYFLGIGPAGTARAASARAFAQEFGHHLQARNLFGIW